MDSDNDLPPLISTSRPQGHHSGRRSLPPANVLGSQHVFPSYPSSTLHYYYPSSNNTAHYAHISTPLSTSYPHPPLQVILFSYLCLQLHNHIFLLLDVLLLLLLLKIYVLNIFQFLLLLTYEIMSVLTILNAYKQSLPLPLLNRNLYLFMLHRNPFLYHLTRPLYHLIPFQPHMYLSIVLSLLQMFLLRTYKLLT